MAGLASRLHDPHDGAESARAWFTRERTARKQHQCANCLHPVRPGQRYLYHAIPPESDIGNPGWWHSITHLTYDDCTWS